MAQEGQTAKLYDFLYRDHSRFSSFYAQLFGGKLATIERTSSERRQTDLTGKAGFSFLGGERKAGTEVQEIQKEVIDPHDIVALDVLAQLKDTARFRNDPSLAPAGSILLVKGSVVFIDRGMIEVARLLIDAAVEAEQQKPKNQRNKATIASMGSMSQILSKLAIPSSFCFRTETSEEIVGVIHDEGMSEPISSYYFKHGAEGIPDVHLVGIKEAKTASVQFPQNEFITASRSVAEVLHKLIFPETAIRVSPIAVFRTI